MKKLFISLLFFSSSPVFAYTTVTAQELDAVFTELFNPPPFSDLDTVFMLGFSPVVLVYLVSWAFGSLIRFMGDSK